MALWLAVAAVLARGASGLLAGERSRATGPLHSVATAKREIALFFAPGELLEYARVDEAWTYE